MNNEVTLDNRWFTEALHRVKEGAEPHETFHWLMRQLHENGIDKGAAGSYMMSYTSQVKELGHSYSDINPMGVYKEVYSHPPRDPAADPSTLYTPTAARASHWPPPLEEAALHGLPGDVVRAIEPHSEADIPALLSQFLLLFGNVIGHNAHWCAEDDEHHLNLFVVVVGRTAKGRKGTAVRRQLELRGRDN